VRAHIFGDKSSIIVSKTVELCLSKNFILVDSLENADLGIAPLLTYKIPPAVLGLFKHGVLIFHPSLLPMHGGGNAIKEAFKRGAYYSGVTWFWASEKFDSGDICEQSAIRIDSESPREYYENKCVPEAIRLLDYALDDIKNGVIRRRKQNLLNGSYERRNKCGKK